MSMTRLPLLSCPMLTLAELQEFSRRLCKTLQASSLIADLYIQRQNEALENLLVTMAHKIEEERYNTWAEQLATEDRKRDACFTSLYKTLESLVLVAEVYPNKGLAAEQILSLISKRDINIYGNPVVESMEIRNFLNDLVVAHNREALDQSGCSHLADLLAISQRRYDEIMELQATQRGSTLEGPTIKEMRSVLTMRIMALLSYLEMNRIDFPKEYVTSVRDIAELILTVMVPARQRVLHQVANTLLVDSQ